MVRSLLRMREIPGMDVGVLMFASALLWPVIWAQSPLCD